jgi:hypothetical protein
MQWSEGNPIRKLVSKETLNHTELIRYVSGMDPRENTPEAFRRAYVALGIDLVNRVPLDNAPPPLTGKATRAHPSLPYTYSALGLYPTATRHSYACEDADEVIELAMDAIQYEDLVTPTPHSCDPADIAAREAALGDAGLYYPMLYTTLFMWGVEVLGWEVFMLAAMSDPEDFHDRFLVPCARKSERLVEHIAAASDSPFVFLHDDLADARGPVFPPAWYEENVFPHYSRIFAPAKDRGKKVILVADGDMSRFLPRLVELGVDGIMFETPATPLAAVLKHFGCRGRFAIGGASSAKLSFGTPAEVRDMVLHVYSLAKDAPGFALAAGGGLHDGIPMKNLEAYFDARAEIGATPQDWRTCTRVGRSSSPA